MAPNRHFSAASLPPAAAPSCFWSSTSPQDGPCGDHMPLRAVLSSPQKQATAHSTGVAELGQTQSRAGKGERDPHPLPGTVPKQRRLQPCVWVLPASPLQPSLSGGSVSGREGTDPFPAGCHSAVPRLCPVPRSHSWWPCCQR